MITTNLSDEKYGSHIKYSVFNEKNTLKLNHNISDKRLENMQNLFIQLKYSNRLFISMDAHKYLFRQFKRNTIPFRCTYSITRSVFYLSAMSLMFDDFMSIKRYMYENVSEAEVVIDVQRLS